MIQSQRKSGTVIGLEGNGVRDAGILKISINFVLMLSLISLLIILRIYLEFIRFVANHPASLLHGKQGLVDGTVLVVFGELKMIILQIFMKYLKLFASLLYHLKLQKSIFQSVLNQN